MGTGDLALCLLRDRADLGREHGALGVLQQRHRRGARVQLQRQIGRDRVRRRMMADVPLATLVIANPTHYAIALRYNREEGGAPMVVAKGADLVALKIREIAEANDVPVIEDKLLARSMYDHVEIDQMIPPQFFKAIAEIIYFLHSRTGSKVGVATA